MKQLQRGKAYRHMPEILYLCSCQLQIHNTDEVAEMTPGHNRLHVAVFSIGPEAGRIYDGEGEWGGIFDVHKTSRQDTQLTTTLLASSGNQLLILPRFPAPVMSSRSAASRLLRQARNLHQHPSSQNASTRLNARRFASSSRQPFDRPILYTSAAAAILVASVRTRWLNRVSTSTSSHNYRVLHLAVGDC